MIKSMSFHLFIVRKQLTRRFFESAAMVLFFSASRISDKFSHQNGFILLWQLQTLATALTRQTDSFLENCHNVVKVNR